MSKLIFFIFLLPFVSIAQAPENAQKIADSICQARMTCPTSIILESESLLRPESNEDDKGYYFFSYTIQVQENITTSLRIWINNDFSIYDINGLSDVDYAYSYCDILSRKKLWKAAKKNGLTKKYKKSTPRLHFEENGLFVSFDQFGSEWNIHIYVVNALTGEFSKTIKESVDF